MTENTPREEIARLATLYADTCEWLGACPLNRNDGFYETAGYALEEIADDLKTIAAEIGRTDIVESIATAITEGEYGGYDDEVLFWRHIAAIATE